MEPLATITSRDNQRLHFARSVRDRRTTDRILVEGVRLAEEAINSALNISDYFVTSDFGSTSREVGLLVRLAESGARGYAVSQNLLASIADTKNSQGIILLCEPPISFDFCTFDVSTNNEPPIIVFLFEISDPANLGAVLRTSEAAGAAGVIVSQASTDVFAPKALRASMGSAFRIPIAIGADSDEVIEWCNRNGLITIGAVVSASTVYTQVDWTLPTMLVIGSEGHGIEKCLAGKLDHLTQIKMENGVESLNLAVSAGVILFEAKRQREWK